MTHDTEDPTRTSAADAAGLAADYSARATYARGWEDGVRSVIDVDKAQWFKTNTDAIKAERDEVGIQLAAAQAVIARMRPVVEMARFAVASVGAFAGATETVWALDRLNDALRALDTVPGDALPPTSPAGASAQPIDTDDVKGVG